MKAFIKTLAISLSSLTLFCSFSIAQSGGSSSARSVERIAELSRSIERASLRGSDTRAAAKERFSLMRSLAETDPSVVLSSALSPHTLSRAPEASRKYLETRETIEGELEVMAECEEHAGRIEYFVKQGDRRLQLYFAGEPDTQFVTGKKISVDAVKLDDILVASADSIKSADSTATVTQNSLTNTTGEKRVLVILVNFQDKQTQPFTVEQARNVTFNTTSNYFYENSYGQTWLTGDVYGWYTIPVSSTVCDKNAIATYAKQAATSAGANVAAYTNVVYAFPSNACTFTGSANVGGSQPQVWINEWFELGVLGHELGHNLGLYHSRSMDCGSVSIGGTCTTSEYGDTIDVMGAASSAHFNVFQKERLGWLNAGTGAPVQAVTSSGTYSIDGYASPGTNTKGLKILRSTDPVTGERSWYYLERRSAFGFDSYLGSNLNVSNGVLIHTGSDNSPQNIYLLDMTPETTSWFDPALAVGRSFADSAAGITITVLSTDNGGASVQVQMNEQPCNRANPSVVMTPGQSSWLSAGSAFDYQVTITNNNSGGCAGESFDLAASLPAALSASFSKQSVSLANGTSGAVVLNVASGVLSADAVYGFNVSAANTSSASHSASAAGSYVLVSGLGVTATPSAPKYSRAQTATVTAAISAAGAPVVGATVTFTLKKPNGAVVTSTLLSGANGTATFSYKFDKRRDPIGSWVVNVAANFKEYTGKATTSFSVSK